MTNPDAALAHCRSCRYSQKGVESCPGIAHAPAVLLHQLAPRVVAAWLDARRERMYSGDSETEKIANTTLEFAAHDLRRTSGLSPVVDSPAPAPAEPVAFWCEPHNEFRLAGCNVTPGCLAQRNLAGNPFDKCKEYPLYTVPAPMAQGEAGRRCSVSYCTCGKRLAHEDPHRGMIWREDKQRWVTPV